MALQNRSYTPDIEMLLADGAAAVTATAAGTVGGSDKILDVGNGRFEAVALVDVSALDIVSNNEEYDVLIQGSNSATFASGIENLAQLNLGATEVRQGGAQDSVVGRYELPFINQAVGTIYKYLRAYLVIAGTTPTITVRVWVMEKP